MNTKTVLTGSILIAASAALVVAAVWPKSKPGGTRHEAPDEAPVGMTWIPGGEFIMGNSNGAPDEQPAHAVVLEGYYLDQREVTNREFKAFVDATGYVTTAER